MNPLALIAAPETVEKRAARRSLYGWLLLGLAVRLLLLPAATHPDLLSVYDRVRLWIEPDSAIRLADFHVQALPMLLHRIWVQMLGLPLPDFSPVHWPDPSEDQIFAAARTVFQDPAAPTRVALWKLPYLLAELATIAVVAASLPRRAAATAGGLWAFHPVLLYGGALFGKYEAFALLPLAVGFRELGRGRDARAAAALGIAVAMRVHPIIAVLPALCAAGSTPRRRVELLAVAALPGTVFLGAAWLGPLWWLVMPALAWLCVRLYESRRGRPGDLVLLVAPCLAAALVVMGVLADAAFAPGALLHHLRFLLRGPGGWTLFGIAPFPPLYLAVLAWAWRRGSRASTPAERMTAALDAALAGSLVFLAGAFFHPQYAGVCAVLVLLSLHRLRWGLVAHAIQVTGFVILLFLFRAGHTTVSLFGPLADAIFDLPPPQAVLAETLGSRWLALGRILLVAGSALMLLELMRSSVRTKPLARADGLGGSGRVGRRSAPLAILGGGAWILAVLAGPAQMGLYDRELGDRPILALDPRRQRAVGAREGNAAVFEMRSDARAERVAALRLRRCDGAEADPPGARFFALQELPRAGEPSVKGAAISLGRPHLVPGEPGTLQLSLGEARLKPNQRYGLFAMGAADALEGVCVTVQPVVRHTPEEQRETIGREVAAHLAYGRRWVWWLLLAGLAGLWALGLLWTGLRRNHGGPTR